MNVSVVYGEAAYLKILLNAGCLQQTFADARASGRDFHLQPWRKVPIPRYDKSVALHKASGGYFCCADCGQRQN